MPPKKADPKPPTPATTFPCVHGRTCSSLCAQCQAEQAAVDYFLLN
jgi:hypothetical protein